MMSTTAPGDDGFNSIMTVVKMMTTTMVMAKLRCMPSMLSPPPPPPPAPLNDEFRLLPWHGCLRSGCFFVIAAFFDALRNSRRRPSMNMPLPSWNARRRRVRRISGSALV